jgi:CheY-like chemotaxis protein
MSSTTHINRVDASIPFLPSSLHSALTGSGKRHMLNFLIVEDNQPMRDLIRSMISDLAGNVTECDDGADALASYSRCRPDWVLMDIRMKEMDGISATREIKASFPEANIMIVTDYDNANMREAARKAGAREYVMKENLLDVRRILGRQTQAP